MVVISKSTLKSAIKSYPEAELALNTWYDLTKQSDWKNFNEMRKTFNSVESVGNDRYVFNIKGYHFRLISLILFKIRAVYILFISTHKEYDGVNAGEITFKS